MIGFIRPYNPAMDFGSLRNVAIAVGVVSVASIVIVLLFPGSDFACTLDRFQILFTGVLAGLAALVTGGFIYRAAKLPVEAEREREVERENAMKTAGAAQLLSTANGIRMAVISEAGKPPKDRLGKLVVPDALPSLETISTQDNEVVRELSEFLASASRLDAHTVLETWRYDPNGTHPEEKKAVDDLIAKWEKIRISLQSIAAGGQP